jgi:hypothetical protein
MNLRSPQISFVEGVGFERRGKIGSKRLFFAVFCPKIIGRGKKRVAE